MPFSGKTKLLSLFITLLLFTGCNSNRDKDKNSTVNNTPVADKPLTTLGKSDTTLPTEENNRTTTSPTSDINTTSDTNMTSDTNTTVQELNQTTPAPAKYILHENITTTLFWVGESESPDNHEITNVESAWDDAWLQHYGGVDTPERTTIFPPFKPQENPFYFALPYNDFDDNGNRREDALKVIPWTGEKTWTEAESMVKNRWIKIEANGKTAYAQWEDSGPFEYNDVDYVFGTAAPKNRYNDRAGLDLSPAVWIYLGYDTRNMDNQAKMNWQFVDQEDVPNGPWMEVVTYRQIYWP